MTLREITDKKIWEEFVLSQNDYTFLNSWNWGDFNIKMGHKIWRLGIYEDNPQLTTHNLQLIGAALVIKIVARRGTFLFLPHPIFQIPNFKFQISNFVDYLKELAKKENCSFIRISPALEDNDENKKIFKNLEFRFAPMHMHAENMWILDLNPSEEKLLANMRKATRYLVKKSEKEGIGIIQSAEIKDVELFNKLYEETKKRHHFTPFSLNYLKNELESFNKDGRISIFLAKYQGEIIAGAIIVFFGNSAFYHHGASLFKHQKIPSAHLLQWEIIKETKKRKLKYYNFWGIAPDENPKHPWHGLSLFKKGFGGFRKDYLCALDLPLNYKYWFNYLIEIIHKRKKGL